MRVIGLDVGEKRIGIAKADSSTRIAVPVGYINVDGLEWEEIGHVADLNSTNFFVLGLPRSNEGNETAQSLYVRNFAKTLTEKIPDARIKFQDESLTSVIAEERLKARKKKYEKGDIDAEAAAIILQDYMETFDGFADISPTNIASNENQEPAGVVATVKNAATEARDNVTNLTKKEADKVKLNTKKAKNNLKKIAAFVVFPVFLLTLLLVGGGFWWVNSMLSPVIKDCSKGGCEDIEFVVTEGESKSLIADNLEDAGLIKNAFVFKAYQHLFKSDADYKSGTYQFNKGLSVETIIEMLSRGVNNNDVFSFTILPGETTFDIKKKLIEIGYDETEVEKAFAAKYDFAFLKNLPADASLEGYLFGETHEFYKTDSVEDILKEFLSGMDKVIKDNNLEARYKEQGLSLHEGITLASVVQKEAASSEQPTVAQVFLSRLNLGIPLGSDVTVSYALDIVDPERQTYTDNQSALTVDSCYNTRVNSGLPCGPISNPGLSALLAVAEPSDTSYLYFLTGDDGLMYYSSTEAEHNQNIYSHCQKLCNVSL